MTLQIVANDPAIIAWTAQHLDAVGFDPAGAVGIGFVDDDKPVAGVVFHNRTERDIHVSVFAEDPRWCRRHHLRALFEYPFRQLKLPRMTATTRKGNKRARKLIQGLGFCYEGAQPKYFDDTANGSLVSYGMLADQCKWIM